MKLIITVGCLLMASTCFAQESPRPAGVDSLKNLDNMPVVSDIGNPVSMPVRKGAGTAAAMPTRRMETPGANVGKAVEVLGNQPKELKLDSLNRVNPRKKDR